MMSISQPCAGVRGRDGRGGGLAAAGAGRDEQVRFLVLQVRDPLPPTREGGQVHPMRGQVIPLERSPGSSSG